MNKNLILLFFTIFFLININVYVVNADWVPNGNGQGRGAYGLYNFTNISCNYLFGYLNSSYVQNEYWVNTSGDTMTGNLKLNANLTNLSVLNFNTLYTCTDSTTEGVACWNSDKQTINVVTGFGNVIQVGQELTFTAKNNAGRALVDGEIVYVSGASGEMPEINLSNASNGNTIHNLGMITTGCNNGAACQVTVHGEVHDLNTSAFTEGDGVYLSTVPGQITKIAPSFPNFVVHIGTVTRVHETAGIIDVRPEIDIGNGVTLNSLGIITNLTVIGTITENGTSLNSKYNDTALINSVNNTQNIMNLGFHNSTYSNSLYLNTSSYINYTRIINYPVACSPNTFMTHNDFGNGTITCTSVQETLVSLKVNGNLTLTGYINNTNDGVVRVFNNGCSEIANATGIFMVC